MADGNTTKLVIELETVLRNLNRTLRGLDQIKRKLDSIAAVRFNQRASTAAVDRQAIAAQRLALQQQRLQLQQQRLQIQTQELANRQERARQTADRLARSSERLRQSLTGQNRILEQTARSLNSFGGALLRVGGGLRSLGATAAVLITGPLLALGSIASRSAADIDAIRNRLIATEGSLEAANVRLAQLRQLADDSIGVTRRTALDTFAILATLGDITEATINNQIRAFGRLNAAFTIEDQQLFFRNLLQIFQQGFEIKDIKEAIGRVPIFNILLEQAFGTSNPEQLRALKAAGKITLDTFLAGLAQAVETDPILAGIGESISVRFAKTFERLRDALEPLGQAILGPLERIILAVEPIILKLSEAFSNLSPSVQTAIVAIGLLTTALGPILFIVGGLASGIGALATALAAVLPVLASIGLPALLAILGGLAVVLTEITAVLALVGLAFQRNFLNIRGLVTSAANAVLSAFQRIRAVINEVTQRILPTLQSITDKVVNFVIDIWERYGSTVTEIIRESFEFIVRVTEGFLRTFGDFVDLVLKLIDGDWRGAWNAFARIVVRAIDTLPVAIGRLNAIIVRALIALVRVINTAGIRLAIAAQRLATSFVATLAITLVNEASKVRDALVDMFLIAASSINPTSIVAVLLSRIIAALRKAAQEGIPPAIEEGVGFDVGAGAGIFRRSRKRVPSQPETDAKAARQIADQAAKLREAQDRLDEQREKNRLNLIRAGIEQQFSLTSDGLARELKQLENNFEDRLKTVRAYFDQRRKLEESQIDNELTKEKGLSTLLADEFAARRKAIQAEFERISAEVEGDDRLKGRARQLALQTAEIDRQRNLTEAFNEFEVANAEVSTRILQLQQQRKDLADELLRLEAEFTREIQRQQEELRFTLLEEQGRISDAETGRLKTRFADTLRELRVDVSGLSTELQDALNRVDLSVLQQRLDDLPEPIRTLVELLDIGVKRAQILEAQRLVDDLGAQLRLDETRIQNRVLDGLISQREAQAQIVALQQQYRGVLLDVLRGELAKAEAIKDQGQIIAIQAQIAEVERLGIAIDEVGQDINRALFQDLQAGLSGIFSGARRGFEGLREAAISFGERLLDTLNDIAATSILERIEGLFKPDAENTEGTVGGFISKLFGLQPKQATDAATASATLQTGATAATATFTTGVTTAGATFGTTVLTTAASFASTIIAAAAAFAATVGASSAAQSLGGLGGAFAGVAESGLFPAVPGGVYKFVEGGYPEAVLTTDPRHATKQAAILRAYLKETRGLYGRIKGFASGGFISPNQIDSSLLSGMSHPSVPTSDVGSFAVAGAPSMMKLRQVLVDQRNYRDWLTSSEGEQVVVDILYRNQPVIRKLGRKK